MLIAELSSLYTDVHVWTLSSHFNSQIREIMKKKNSCSAWWLKRFNFFENPSLHKCTSWSGFEILRDIETLNFSDFPMYPWQQIAPTRKVAGSASAGQDGGEAVTCSGQRSPGRGGGYPRWGCKHNSSCKILPLLKKIQRNHNIKSFTSSMAFDRLIFPSSNRSIYICITQFRVQKLIHWIFTILFITNSLQEYQDLTPFRYKLANTLNHMSFSFE